MYADDETTRPAFHAGETLLQERAGLAERMAEVGQRMVRRYMPDQHREFFAQLPYLIVGALDHSGQPWASVLSNPAGFVQSPESTLLEIDAIPTPGDPLAGMLGVGAPLGLLGLEAHTRRRNRANGIVLASRDNGMSVRILESFGNCPKYIQARRAEPIGVQHPARTEAFTQLPAHVRQLITRADTFFIASAHPDATAQPGYGVDVSHRGGIPGFVRIDVSGTGADLLLVPDLAGNFFFNTCGNIALNPRVGLLFLDYDSQDLVHLVGRAELVLDGPELDSYAGAQRLLRITIERGLLRYNALPLSWSPSEISPFLVAPHRYGPWC